MMHGLKQRTGWSLSPVCINGSAKHRECASLVNVRPYFFPSFVFCSLKIARMGLMNELDGVVQPGKVSSNCGLSLGQIT